MKPCRLFWVIFFSAVLTGQARASGYYAGDDTYHPSRQSQFWESVGISGMELDRALGSGSLHQVWPYLCAAPSLQDTYEEALGLEKQGDFADSLKWFKKIDDARSTDWDWAHTAPDPQLVFREAQDRVELYTPLRLAQPRLLRMYLAGRSAYLSGHAADAAHLFKSLAQVSALSDAADKAGFGSLARYMEAFCRAQDAKTSAGAQDYQAFVDQHPSARALFSVSDFALPDPGGLLTFAQLAPSLKRLMDLYPQSRYADDAAYLMASLSIAHQDWPGAQQNFQRLAERFNGDDLVPKGRLRTLADAAAQAFGKSSTNQAFWELAGGKGPYLAQENQWIQLKPFYRPYFMMASLDQESLSLDRSYPVKRHHHKKTIQASQGPGDGFHFFQAAYEVVDGGDGSDSDEDSGTTPDPTERLLAEIIEKYPRHPLRPQALARLAAYYKSQTQYQWGVPALSPQKTAVLMKKEEKLLEELLTQYPRSPLAGGAALGELQRIFFFEKKKPRELIPWAEGVSRFHVVRQDFFDRLKGDDPKPVFKNPRLLEMFYVENDQWGDLVQTFPESRFAPWAFLRLYNNFQDEKSILVARVAPGEDPKTRQQRLRQIKDLRQTIVKPLLGYARWYLIHLPQGPQADCARALEASVLLDSGDPREALGKAEFILGHPATGFTGSNDFGAQEPLSTPAQRYAFWLDEAYWVKARALEMLGKGPESFRAYGDLVDHYPWAPSNSNGYYQPDDESIRLAGQSPYTEYAMGKMALYQEKAGHFSEALKIYSDLKDDADCKDLIANGMTAAELQKFLEKNPDDPSAALARETLGTRYLQDRHYDQALSILGQDPLAEQVKQVRQVYQDIEAQPDPTRRAALEYQAAQNFFRGTGPSFFSYQLLDADLGNGKGTKPVGAKLENTNNLSLAAQGFQRVADLYPQSPLRDRALYSYALCALHEGGGPYGQVDDKTQADAVAHFASIYEKFPGSSLADDGLLWAYFFSRDEKYLVNLAKNTNRGDVMLWMNTKDLSGPSPFERFGGGAGFWRMFFQHNGYLGGTDFSPTDQALLLGSQLQESYIQGGSYSGWYYVKTTGQTPYDATLDLSLKGADESAAQINFNGREEVLPPHAAKNFHLKVPDLQPGISQWIYFRVDQTGPQTIQVSGNLQSEVDQKVFQVPLDPVTAVPQTIALDYQTKDYPLDPGCAALNTDFLDPGRGVMRWAFRRNDGKTQIYSADSGAYYRDTGVRGEPSDIDIHQFIPVQSGELYALDLSKPLSQDKPVAVWSGWNQTGQATKPLMPLPPYGRYAQGPLQAQGGFLVDSRGATVAALPDGVAALPAPPSPPKVQIQPGGAATDTQILVSGLSAWGLPDVRYCDVGSDKVLKAVYLGLDHEGKLYFYLRCSTDDKVQAFFWSGQSAGCFWLKDKMALLDDLDNLRAFVFPAGKARVFSYRPDKQALRVDDFLFNYKPSREEE